MSATNLCEKLGQSVLTFVCNHKRTLVEILCMVAFFVCMTSTISRCTYYKDTNEKNILALTDSIKYYKGKQGNVVAVKGIPKADYTYLKNINDSLYRLVESMKVSGKPDVVIGSNVTIDNGKHDTVWKYLPIGHVPSDTSTFYNRFDFSDKYRSLQGSVKVKDDSMRMSIDKDVVNFNYAMAIKDNQVYITSDNPYVKFNTITGLKIPEQKKVKKFGIGPMIYGGYGNKGFNYGVGIGLQYNLINF